MTTEPKDERGEEVVGTEVEDVVGSAAERRDGGAVPGAVGERKERVLHTRVPAVLERELKQLATALRLPVSNLVRTILEDALAAVDSVGERAEGELRGMAERLSRQRVSLRRGVGGDPGGGEEGADAESVPVCPAGRPALLDGVVGYDRLVLAADAACAVCGRRLGAGEAAFRGVFDDPGRRVFLGGDCRLVPGGSKEV
jgi:hypothetical protein